MKKTLTNEKTDSMEISGLCVNCAEKRFCRFPGFGRNVVHCEEYYYRCPNEREGFRENSSFGQAMSFGIDSLV